MKLNQIPKKITSKPKRLGRGHGSGKGKTAGRGTKGQKARSGFNIPNRFEGGQSSLITRMPKKIGFKARKNNLITVNFNILEKKFKDGEEVSPKSLYEKGLIESKKVSIKILGKGKLTKKLKFKKCLFSRSVKKLVG
ncbi:50S ribosomal protein L15 [Candidatus Berkelbacteria bacterium RIFCSPHIGHO2_12_FULL_36_9]|uniref:Large ribosomal subunit protein uL15 n=1 Tax=Candidatus Berkelbacteria bacterium RIFCSPHIGHO2_12_FULL_36_9 TaxID=1797469 RepID=A0A1F5EDI9_9BACT|nr:MAG: 50S ribosomal protein L15 [Candidatus Berkelbacteria bacterium RIFCSPHIGHO2_12_FULL_36_9]